MDNLISGLLGAAIATVLLVVYLYISEKWKIRFDLVLEVVGYCDDIYQRIQRMHVAKDREYTRQDKDLDSTEYHNLSSELTTLLTSSKLHAKMMLVYGPDAELEQFGSLCNQFSEAASLLKNATHSGWDLENKKLLTLFSNTIDPLRAELESTLVRRSSAPAIAGSFFRVWTPTFYRWVCGNPRPT